VRSWPIRNQILLPIIAIQGLAVTAIALTTASLAARRSEDQIVDRLNGVLQAITHLNFPYTAGILERMHRLSGAHFIAFDREGHPLAVSEAGLVEHASALSSVPRIERFASLRDSLMVEIHGTRYVAATLGPSFRPGGETLLILYPETSWQSARRDAAWPPLALGAGALALMVVVTSWTAHRISRRLRRVESQVARIAAGDFQGVEPGDIPDEVQDLARSVNRMSADLKSMRQEIEQSERARLLSQLAAGLAHQIRNALTGARMSLQLHGRRCPITETDRSLAVALRQITLMEDQVRGILTLGRVEDAPRAACDLTEILEDIEAMVEPSCRHAGVRLEIRPIEPAAQAFQGDAGGLRAAVLNLVLNAVEAAGPGGRVCVDVAIDDSDGTLCIRVTDDGPGPPAEVADRLFEPFVTGKPEGVGLGLALARLVCERHDGTISWVRTEGETCFTIRLPRPIFPAAQETDHESNPDR
jgi:signal transduction histidine kinase